MDNPNESEVIQIMEENKNIKKAIEELEQVSGNEKLRRIAELKEKYIRDEQASIEYAQNVGYKDGYKNGEEEGIKKGKNERNIEIAKNLLSQNIDIEIIENATGLNKAEIEKMKQEA